MFVLPPIIYGSHSEALPWLGYAKRMGFWSLKKLPLTYFVITERPTKNVIVRIKRFGQYAQPYIYALRVVLPAGFIVTPRIGQPKIAFGDVSNHNLVDHTELLKYVPATPYIEDSGYIPPYDTETGLGVDFTEEPEFYESIGGYERVQWFPRYEGNPSYRFFSPTIGDQDSFTTFDTRIESVANVDVKGPENVVLSWYPRSGWTLYYNGLASWVAPGFINGASIKKVVTENETYWLIYVTISTQVGSDSGKFLELWKRRADARDISASELTLHDKINDILFADDKHPYLIYAGTYNPAREIARARADNETEPTLEAVLLKVGEATSGGTDLMPVSGVFSHAAAPGTSLDDVATAIEATVISTYDGTYSGRMFLSVGAASDDDGNTEYIFVYWFSWHGIHDNNAWSMIGSVNFETDMEGHKSTLGESNPANQIFSISSQKAPINRSCNEFALCVKERGSQLEYIGNHLMIYSVENDSSISLKEIRLGNYSLIWGNKFHITDAVFQNPQYVDVDYSGNTIKTLNMNTENLLNGGINSEGLPGFRVWTAFKYIFPWRTNVVDGANAYIEAYDLRHSKLVWTKMDSSGVKTFFDSGDAVDEVIYSSSTVIIETDNNHVWYDRRISTNTVTLATLPNGITLLSAVLSANPIGMMADYQAQFPTFSWSGPNADADSLLSGYFYLDDFDRVDVNNTVGLFDLWPNFSSEYPFSVANPPEVATVNILTNNENPGEILKLPDAGAGQLMTLSTIGIYGFSDGSDPLGILTL